MNQSAKVNGLEVRIMSNKWALVTCLAFGFSLIFGGSIAFAEGAKIGYVDLQKCLLTTIEGKKAHDKLKVKKDAMQREIDTRQNELEKVQADLKKQGLMLSAEAQAEKDRDYQKNLREFKNMVNEYNEEIKAEEDKLKAKILSGLAKVVEKIGQEKGYILILEKSSAGILWAPDTEELTDVVIKAYDAQVAKGGSESTGGKEGTGTGSKN
jgi:outer membrane protein